MKPILSIYLNTINSNKQTITNIQSFCDSLIPDCEFLIISDPVNLNAIQKHINIPKNTFIRFINYEGEKNAARNYGYLKSRGKYALFIDNDMFVDKNFARKLINSLKRNSQPAYCLPETVPHASNLSTRILRIEKQFAQTDPGAISPRLFKRNLFSLNQLPFSEQYGILDEWGFTLFFENKHININFIDTPLYLSGGLSADDRIKKSFQKGKAAKFSRSFDLGRSKRTNIHYRTQSYFRHLNIFLSDPLAGILFLLIKPLELLSFLLGYYF